jgi:hypothetical protein
MSIPSTEREQILVSSSSDELQTIGIVVKGTYWIVFSSHGNLHLKEYEGGYSLRIAVAVPHFHVTNALDIDLNILTDRFWLWKIKHDNTLELVEIEPIVNGDAIIHSTTQIDTNIKNVRVYVEGGKYVKVYRLDVSGNLVLKTYANPKNASPNHIVPMNWGANYLDSFDTTVDSDHLKVSYANIASPPNIYVEDYFLTVPQLIVYSQIGMTLNVNLVWDDILSAESYRLARSTDPLFSTYIIVFNGLSTSFVDTVPSYNASYYYCVKMELPSLGIESEWSTVKEVHVGSSPGFFGTRPVPGRPP